LDGAIDAAAVSAAKDAAVPAEDGAGSSALRIGASQKCSKLETS